MVEVRTRGERRSEKKQSFVLIAFLVTVAIVCFASGFMVGRNTAPRTTASIADGSNTSRMPIAKKAVGAKPVEQKKESEKLTFYEALPKGEQQPLGSGINLPPETMEKPEPAVVKQVAVAPETVKTPIPEKVFQAAKPAPVVKPAKPQVDPEKVKYILQIASFPQPDEAGKLLGKLTQGGYDVYVQQADLGSKGVWYRVFVGPVTGKSRATSMQGKIEREFKVKPILRKP
jgi:cell division septation protein DedD